ncbi:hypothetical protein XBO1_870006 [Xenorhabdus bovienii str. oregonense]|uniref:Uncharacterized protein n=1 Tax=Xenorhabdus bovienii str. oregonense TaxID=1398202 RepID=A0A077PED4_XENBV|nr:hypothetical protein [Xenorhabdus bovienii]CDH08096.1 hypothetical protein XBO1_870006 [Xenorhabdus bovienii str. oregonense]
MIIHINEDGSTTVTVAGYQATYDRDGKLKESFGCSKYAPEILLIPSPLKQKADKEQIGITSDKFKVYDAGITLAVDTGAKARIAADGFKVFNVARKVYMKEAVIPQAVIKDNDDHLRQIVREEIRQFVTRESGRGGLFSKW